METTAGRHFVEKRFYQATVLKQEFVRDSKGTETLSLTCQLKGLLVDDFDPEKGLLEDIPKVKVEVRLAFPAEDDNRYKIALRDLMSLGYEEDTLDALNPANRGVKKEKFFELEGRDVYVTPSYKTYNDSERTFWNLRFPKGRKAEQVGAGEMKKGAKAERYKALMQELKNAGSSPF